MYRNIDCAHPRRSVVRYGGKRRLCRKCGATFRVRPKRRGRKRKRSGIGLASTVLVAKPSLRGLAKARGVGRESLRRAFQRSVGAWLRAEGPASPFGRGSGPLALILDGFWFRIRGEKLACLVVLARRTAGGRARLRGLFLARGGESEANWEAALAASLTAAELAKVTGVTADGSHGLVPLCERRGWLYQRCHFHAISRFEALCSGRISRSRAVRTLALALVRGILGEPDERKSRRMARRLRLLAARPDCPATVRNAARGFLMGLPRFRTIYAHPESGLPTTSNSAECVASVAREVFSRTRGMPTERSLRKWLDICMRLTKDFGAE